MSLKFDGTDDEITWSKGSVVGTGAITLVVLAKITAAAADWASMLNLETSGDVNELEITRRGTSTFIAMARNAEAQMSDSAITFAAADGWCVISAAKASGSVAPSITKAVIGGSPSTGAGGTALTDSDAWDKIVFGNMAGADFFEGLLAAVAIFDSALSQADRESLASNMTRANWLAKGAVFLVDALDGFQTDHAGTSTRTAIVGTVPSGDNPAGWAQWAGPAFPINAVIDSFTRADENPLGSPWGGILTTGEAQLQLLSNQGAGSTADVFNGSVITGPFGPDCEAYMTLATIDVGNRAEVYARVFNDASGIDAYCVSVVGSTWSIRKKTNSSDAALGANHTQALSAGDSIGIRCIGDEIQAWYKPSGGIWTMLFTRNDTTWTAAGGIGARMFGTTYRIDDFGGGTITPQEARPDADVTTTGWSTTPLWSKIEESSADGTVISATAS